MKIISVIALIFFIFLQGCGSTGEQPVAYDQDHSKPHKHDSSETGKLTKHYEESIFRLSEKGRYSVEMLLRSGELKTGVNTIDIIVHDKHDNDVTGAKVKVVPWMPEMGHGVFETPLITEKGGGLYNVENVIFSMSGHWELKISINKDGLEDRVVFDLPQVGFTHGHKKRAMPKPSEMDISKSKKTDKELYTVSYESNSKPIPVNKMHRWLVRVTDKAGQPVSNAEITFTGDMPEHGHGMPTAPKVIKKLDDGYYIVGGIKFNMPGWWIITISIKNRGHIDKASFQIML